MLFAINRKGRKRLLASYELGCLHEIWRQPTNTGSGGGEGLGGGAACSRLKHASEHKQGNNVLRYPADTKLTPEQVESCRKPRHSFKKEDDTQTNAATEAERKENVTMPKEIEQRKFDVPGTAILWYSSGCSIQSMLPCMNLFEVSDEKWLSST